jgi:integrase
MIGSLLNAMREKDETGKPRTSMALREHIRCPLKRYYHDLIKHHGFTAPNPAADLADYMGRQLSKRARKTTAYAHFTQDEAPELFRVAAEHFPRYLAFIGCGALAGMRWGEAAGLIRSDIQWSKGVIHLQREWCYEARVVKDLKDHENRYVPMPTQLAEWLRAHLEAVDLEAQVQRWTDEQRALVFPNRVGRHMHHPTFLTDVWRPLLAAAKLPYRKAHALRHSFATWCLEGNPKLGFPPQNILRVRDWLGHSSVEETERYAHVNSVNAGGMLDALGAAVVAKSGNRRHSVSLTEASAR